MQIFMVFIVMCTLFLTGCVQGNGNGDNGKSVKLCGSKHIILTFAVYGGFPGFDDVINIFDDGTYLHYYKGIDAEGTLSGAESEMAGILANNYSKATGDWRVPKDVPNVKDATRGRVRINGVGARTELTANDLIKAADLSDELLYKNYKTLRGLKKQAGD